VFRRAIVLNPNPIGIAIIIEMNFFCSRNPYLAALIAIIRYKKLDWKAIHNYGMHLADTRPPLHVSSEEMIIYMNEAMAKVLQSIKKDPILITISR